MMSVRPGLTLTMLRLGQLATTFAILMLSEIVQSHDFQYFLANTWLSAGLALLGFANHPPGCLVYQNVATTSHNWFGLRLIAWTGLWF